MNGPPRPSLLAAVLVLAAAADAAAQVPIPQGGTPVVIGRVYHRDAGGTRPVGVFGLVLPSKGEGRARVEVPSVEGDPATGYELRVAARSRRGAAELSWELVPSAGGGAAAGSGSAEVRSGQLGHADLATVGSTRVYASLEHGRASSFDAVKLARHFGLPLGGGPAPRAPRAPVPSPAPAAPAARAQPVPVRPAPAEAGGVLVLRFRLERDGETAFAPRVRVRAGEEFAVRSGDTLEAGGARWDGFELSGTATRGPGGCRMDLAVQSGRKLESEGPETWLVDRYRRDVAVPTGRESVVELFEELEGEDAGRLRLFIECRPE